MDYQHSSKNLFIQNISMSAQKLSQRSQREKNKEAYLTRIANRLSGDNTHYSEVFKRWEFVPDTKRNVQFQTAKCQICDNTYLKNLFKIRPVEEYRHLIPKDAPNHYMVGAVCVENFCHKDQAGNRVRPQKKRYFVNCVKQKKLRELFYENLEKRLEEANLRSLFSDFQRLRWIYNSVLINLRRNVLYTFETMSDAIVFAVLLGYDIKQFRKYFFRIKKPSEMRLSNMSELSDSEASFYLRCYQKFSNNNYQIVKDVDSDDEDDKIQEKNEESSSMVEIKQ